MKALRLFPAVLEDTAQAAQRYDKEGYVGLADRFLAVFFSSLPHLHFQSARELAHLRFSSKRSLNCWRTRNSMV